MDTVLIGLTALSLLLAAGMGFLLFRLVREERQRAEARVAVLAAAAALSHGSIPLQDSPDAAGAPRSTEVDGRTAELFSGLDTPSAWPWRLAVAAALALAITAAGYALAPDGEAPRTPQRQMPAPLELVALRHVQEAGVLTIRGMVVNPRSGLTVSHVSVAAQALGETGATVGSGQAGLDYRTLAPGAESPFVVTIPITGAVHRYRVAFRASDGAVVAHVDRRTDGAAAQNERTTGGPS